jgi:hypothetical protein
MKRLLLASLLAMSCETTVPPGTAMGTFTCSVTPLEYACGLSDVTDGGFGFSMVLSHDLNSTQAWVTVGGYTRDAGFDGQVMESTAEADRIFDQCAECRTRMIESMRFTVLSRSQWAAQGSCLADGGYPAPDADAGITAPGPSAQGYDAQYLCGQMTETVVSDGLPDGGACPAICGGCFIRYQLQGARG